MSREKYILSPQGYELLKNIHLGNLKAEIGLHEDECAVVVEDVDSLLHSINVELLMFGLKNDGGPNDYGDALYGLYDEIYFNDEPTIVE